MVKNLMRVAVIAILLLSCGALALGLMLFQQREMLKGRTQKLESAIKQVASTIEAGDNTTDKLMLNDAQLQTYKPKPGGPASMENPLNQLNFAAQNQLMRLDGARKNLAETRTNLEATKNELNTTKKELKELSETRDTVVSLNETIAARNATIAEKDSSIKTLEAEKINLNARLNEQTAQISELETNNKKLNNAISELKEEVDRLAALPREDKPDKPPLSPGEHGRVLLVNSNWNFMVIGLTSAESRAAVDNNTEFLIRRNEKLVGKARVQSVHDGLLIADIVKDSTPIQPRKGDHVIY